LPSCRSAWNRPWSRAWAQEAPRDVLGQGLTIQAGQVERGGIGQRHALRPGQGQDPLAHALPADQRRAHIRIDGHGLAQLGAAGGLEAQVHLQVQGADHHLDELGGAQAAGGGNQFLGQARGQAQHGAVLGDLTLDAGAQHLDRDLAAIDQRGRMGLGQGGGGDRLADLQIDFAQRLAEVALDLGLGDRHRERRQAVLQVRQVLGEGGPEDVGSRRQKLAHLDGRRALVFQHPRQAFSRPTAPRRRAGEQAQQPARQLGRRRQQRLGLARNQGVGPDQGPAGSGQAPEGGEIGHQLRAPSPGAGPRRRR
jgi:hypothetical protein